MEDLDKRLASEVTALLTKLVTEVAKLLELEEVIVHLRRELQTLRQQAAVASATEQIAARTKTEHQALLEKYRLLYAKQAATEKARQEVETKNKQLEAEVEDLTASLFNEANQMVLNASRETHNFKVKNRKLYEEMEEKDNIIASLQEQLLALRVLLAKQDALTPQGLPRPAGPERTRLFLQPDPWQTLLPPHTGPQLGLGPSADVLDQFVFGPRARLIRFDLPVYGTDFKAFVYQLIRPDFAFDLPLLKSIKYFRRLWTEELEPVLPQIPTLLGATFMSRWLKGKLFWALLVEGKASIEPVAGINETFRLSYRGAKESGAVPVALKAPCAFCHEDKDDMLEHARLHTLKLHAPAEADPLALTDSLALVPGHALVGTYPLCNFCLVKLRALCNFFATLRVVRSNVHKLLANRTFDDVAFAANFPFKRADLPLLPRLTPADEPVLVKIYLMLAVLRAKIFWSKIGFWDTDDDVKSLALAEVKTEVFRALVREKLDPPEPVVEQQPAFETVSKPPPAEKTKRSVSAVLGEAFTKASADEAPKPEQYLDHSDVDDSTVGFDTVNEKEADYADADYADVTADYADDVSSATDAPHETEEPKDEPEENQNTKEEPREVDAPEEASTPVSEDRKESDSEDFQDTQEELQPEKPSEASPAKDGKKLSRKKSKSKAFKKKMNKDLDNTLAMLQESLGPET